MFIDLQNLKNLKNIYLFKILYYNRVTKTKREIVLNNNFVNNVYIIIYIFDKDKDFSIYCFLINKNNIVQFIVV